MILNTNWDEIDDVNGDESLRTFGEILQRSERTIAIASKLSATFPNQISLTNRLLTSSMASILDSERDSVYFHFLENDEMPVPSCREYIIEGFECEENHNLTCQRMYFKLQDDEFRVVETRTLNGGSGIS